MPCDHGHILATFHQAGEREVGMAIEAALAKMPDARPVTVEAWISTWQGQSVSVPLATQVDQTHADMTAPEEAKDRSRRQLVIALGNDEAGETALFRDTIPPSLMMLHGE